MPIENIFFPSIVNSELRKRCFKDRERYKKKMKRFRRRTFSYHISNNIEVNRFKTYKIVDI